MMSSQQQQQKQSCGNDAHNTGVTNQKTKSNCNKNMTAVTCGTKCCRQKLGQHTVHYLFKFQRYERDHEFVIDKNNNKNITKHFDKINTIVITVS